MSSDDFNIEGAFVHGWCPPAPRAVLLVVHGMAEHGGRYARLAAQLSEAGVAVYAPDLPGHGHTAANGTLGHFADRDGWRHALDAVAAARAAVAQRHPGLPLFLLGHSMGSFLSQYVIAESGEGLAGVILSATTADLGAMRSVGLTLLKVERLLRGPRVPSKLGDLLGFSAFNRAFAPNRTAFDWLSRDEAEVDAYIADPLCGFACTPALWADLLSACAGLDAPVRLSRIPKALPLLFIAGEVDPVCQGRRGPEALATACRDAGVSDVEVRTWPEARHELLNETCREAVMDHLRGWIEARL